MQSEDHMTSGSEPVSPRTDRTIRAAILDDEPLARARLRRLLGAMGSHNIKIVAECVDAEEMLRVAKTIEIDVLFLDVEMPGPSGIDVISGWQGARPHIVFVTAHENYSIPAFDVGAIDYLVKPVMGSRLRDTVRRITNLRDSESSSDTQMTSRKIALPIGNRKHLVALDSINLVEAHGNYVEIRTSSSSYMVRGTLSDLIEHLGPTFFIRIHRSSAVRKEAVREIKPVGSGRYRIILDNGWSVTSGRFFSTEIRRILSDKEFRPKN